MSLTAILDISSIIWNLDDYNSHKHHYYDLQENMIALIEHLEELKPKILVRSSLLDQMFIGFPMVEMPDSFYEFGSLVYGFLANIGNRIEEYSDIESIDKSIPNLVKTHFNEETRTEMTYLVSWVHSKSYYPQTYFTFEHLHGGRDNLRTMDGEFEYEHQTLLGDDPLELKDFFTKFKRIFDPNPKHDRVRVRSIQNSRGEASPLSCYDGKHCGYPQRLLDDAEEDEGIYFSFDAKNKVYVIFRCHKDNLWHGYDERDRKKIPEHIKDKFHQW